MKGRCIRKKELCNQTFLQITNLNVQRSIKDPKNSKQFNCEHCDIQFHRKYDLLRHIRVVHSAEIASTEFQCKHCEQKFADMPKL